MRLIETYRLLSRKQNPRDAKLRLYYVYILCLVVYFLAEAPDVHKQTKRKFTNNNKSQNNKNKNLTTK